MREKAASDRDSRREVGRECLGGAISEQLFGANNHRQSLGTSRSEFSKVVVSHLADWVPG